MCGASTINTPHTSIWCTPSEGAFLANPCVRTVHGSKCAYLIGLGGVNICLLYRSLLLCLPVLRPLSPTRSQFNCRQRHREMISCSITTANKHPDPRSQIRCQSSDGYSGKMDPSEPLFPTATSGSTGLNITPGWCRTEQEKIVRHSSAGGKSPLATKPSSGLFAF